MRRNRELAKNAVIIAIGQICTQFVTFFLLPVYTRYLAADEYGTIDLVLACTSLIAPIISLQLERSVFRYLIDARNDQRKQNRIITSSLATISACSLVSAVVIPVIGLMLGIQYLPYITALIILTTISNVLLQIPRGLGKNIHYAIGGMIIGILNAVVSIILTVFLGAGIKGVLSANIIAHLIGIIYLIFATKLFSRLRLQNRDKQTLKEMLKFSMPMIPSDIVYWVINASDRVLIAIFLGSAANGIYAAAVKFPTLIVAAYNIFNMSWIESVSVHINDEDSDKYISKTLNAILRAACSLCAIATALTPLVFNIVIGSDYSDARNYVPVLIAGSFFNIIMGALSAIYFGLKRTKDIAKSNILAAILNIIINVVFIEIIGIHSAAISTLLAYMIVSFWRIIDIRKTTKISIDFSTIAAATLVLTISSVLFYIDNIYVKIANVVLILMLSLIANRRIIVKMTNIFKKMTKGSK